MPELPEVESVVSGIRPDVVGKTIEKTEILLERLIKTDLKEFKEKVTGSKITSVERRGKYILIYLDNQYILVVHLRMTGALIFFDANKEINESHGRIKFILNDGSVLVYSDSRTLGTLDLIADIQEMSGLAGLGPEPLSKEFSSKYLQENIKDRRGSIKGLLLDQKIIAGLGNIYVDESLFRSGIRPDRSGMTLTKKEIEKLHKEIRAVISEALGQGGTTFRDYRNGRGESGNFQTRLKVYGQDGKDCTICNNKVEKTRVAGRGTHFCSQCQK